MANIQNTHPERVEKYFELKGIPATFRRGSDYARKFVAYCCYNVAEMFNQLSHALPSRISTV